VVVASATTMLVNGCYLAFPDEVVVDHSMVRTSELDLDLQRVEERGAKVEVESDTLPDHSVDVRRSHLSSLVVFLVMSAVHREAGRLVDSPVDVVMSEK